MSENCKKNCNGSLEGKYESKVGKSQTCVSLTHSICRTLLERSQNIIRGDFETYLLFFRHQIDFAWSWCVFYFPGRTSVKMSKYYSATPQLPTPQLPTPQSPTPHSLTLQSPTLQSPTPHSPTLQSLTLQSPTLQSLTLQSLTLQTHTLQSHTLQ